MNDIRRRFPMHMRDFFLMLLKVKGDFFIRSDELDAAWALFTPVLNELEGKKIVPEYHPYGGRGPVALGAHYLVISNRLLCHCQKTCTMVVGMTP
ncbi:unnamed protein product [Ilex paraguariensis]|uniref:Glucose-6-phosphate 1-dehydrogenase n=1 Tax=Ilex paraguariensis TaxID=185542 RepID=A0ABC8TWJ4_9AQUA